MPLKISEKLKELIENAKRESVEQGIDPGQNIILGPRRVSATFKIRLSEEANQMFQEMYLRKVGLYGTEAPLR